MVASVQPSITNLPQECVRVAGLRFEENGAGTYTGTITIPAYAVLLDVIVNAEVLWAAGTSAALEVGDDDDPDGFYAAIDLKATDLLAGESLDFIRAGAAADAGAYLETGTSTHISARVSTAERTITATVTSVGAGTAGRTIVAAVYAVPTLEQVTI